MPVIVLEVCVLLCSKELYSDSLECDFLLGRIHVLLWGDVGVYGISRCVGGDTGVCVCV